MKGKKDFLAAWLYKTGLFRLLESGSGNRFIVINYHRIWSGHQQKKTLFDDEVFGPTRDELGQHFHWLKHNMDVLSEDDLLSIAWDGTAPPARGVLVTFDDGYIDNYTVAYPLLRDYGLPAIFFLPTQAIEKRTLGWWDYVAYLLKKTEHKTIVFEGKEVKPGDGIQQAIHYVLSFIDYNRKDIKDVLSELSTACEVELPDIAVQSKELMSWDNIREICNNGVSVGAHTHSHTILSSLDPEVQKDELRRSKQIIEERVGVKVRSMSYPVGNYHHFTEETKKIAMACGYELAFSFLTGINTWEELDAMDVKRISVSGYLPRFIGTMNLPGLFCDCA